MAAYPHIKNPAGFGRVVVLMGGNSAEREISLLSGTAVLAALQRSGVDAHAFDPRDLPLADLVTQRLDALADLRG